MDLNPKHTSRLSVTFSTNLPSQCLYFITYRVCRVNHQNQSTKTKIIKKTTFKQESTMIGDNNKDSTNKNTYMKWMRERWVQSLDRHETIEQIGPRTRPKILCTPLLEARSSLATGRRDFPVVFLFTRVYVGLNQCGSVAGMDVNNNSGWVLIRVGSGTSIDKKPKKKW